MHLLVDCFRCGNQPLLEDPNGLKRALVELSEVGGMTHFGEPVIVDYPFPMQEDKTKSALSGVLFLGESSVTIHTYPEKQSVFIDVFHCLPFQAGRILSWLVERFDMNLDWTDTFLFERGVSNDNTMVRTRPMPWSGIAISATREMSKCPTM